MFKSVIKRVSRPVIMPTKFLSLSTTGKLANPFFLTISVNSLRVKSGVTVTGSETIPLSNFFTLRTRSAWRSIDIFLWINPIPPSWASEMASLVSVTVSIAADNIGIFRRMVLVSCVDKSAVFGSTVECAGTSRTSSKVRASCLILSIAIFSLN